MGEDKEDRRVARTRQLLRDALVSLILERGYDEVTVQDVLDRANLGRSTFYAHYRNKDDLLFSGFEEFAALLPVGDLGEAVAIADRVRRNFAAAAAVHACDGVQPSVSVGATLGCDPKVPVSDLLASADQALYRAKSAGRNQVVGFRSSSGNPAQAA